MPKPFTRSLRALEEDRFRPTLIGIGIAAAFLGAWALWFATSSLPVRVVSTRARVEIDRASYPVQTPVAGRVVASALVLGRQVRADDVLVELDGGLELQHARQEQSAIDAASASGDAIARQLESEDAELRAGLAVATMAVAEAQARVDSARIAAQLADQERARAAQLRERGLLSEVEWQRTFAAARQKAADAEALVATVRRLESERDRLRMTSGAKVAALRRDRDAAAGEVAVKSSALAGAQYAAERFRIRAPAGGALADVADLRAGAVVSAGDTLGIVLAPGRLSMVAYFEPAEAFGRVAPAQSAFVRLDAFPWVEYGVVRARVISVAGEVRDGLLRVELEIATDSRGRIPWQHGLQGQVEVEIDKASPARLLLRTLGAKLTAAGASARP